MTQAKIGLEEGNVEVTLGYIEGMGITQYEYFEKLEDVAYKMFQREALWNQVCAEGEYDSYDEYSKNLVEKANIQIFDPELKQLLGAAK